MSRYDKFRPVCPRCGDRLMANAQHCPACGAKSGLVPLPPVVRKRPARIVKPEPRPVELPPCTSTRYVVRECEGYKINFPLRRLAFHAQTNIECVVLDTAWNHRLVASFTSEQFSNGRSRAEGFALARHHAAVRCEALNRLDEIARGVAA